MRDGYLHTQNDERFDCYVSQNKDR
jgi:hypothetical protein